MERQRVALRERKESVFGRQLWGVAVRRCQPGPAATLQRLRSFEDSAQFDTMGQCLITKFVRLKKVTLWHPFAFLFACLATTGSYSQTASDEKSLCPGASAWRAAHLSQLPTAIAERDRNRVLSNQELLSTLQVRVDRDQEARRRLLTSPNDPRVREQAAEIDDQNLSWLLAQLRSHGMPTAEQVGEHGLQLAWLLVQHADADPKLQELALGEFEKRYRSGEFSADSLAKLTDRVLLAKGKSQRYGTQFDWFSGRFDLKGILKIDEIDAHRAELGLMPLSDYACFMTSALQRRRGHAEQ